MHKWEKLGEVFRIADHKKQPWMMEYCQAPNAIELENAIRIFFSTRESMDSGGKYRSYIAYVDVRKDNPLDIIGVSDHPVLSLGSLGSFDEFGTYPLSVTKKESDYIGLYGGWTRMASVPFDVSIGLVRGTQIDRLEKCGNGPVITRSQFQPFICASPKIRYFHGKLFCYYTFGHSWTGNSRPDPSYSITLATSTDGISWERENKAIIPNTLGSLEAQASPDVFWQNGRYHMYFCYRSHRGFRENPDLGYKIGYASSQDLFVWQRDDSQHNLRPSDAGWDSDSISYPNVLQVGSETYMFYLGKEIGRYSFGVARLASASN